MSLAWFFTERDEWIIRCIKLHQNGLFNRQTAKELWVYKGTVNSYLSKIKAGKLDIDGLPALENPVLEGCFHTGNPACLEDRFNELKQLSLKI